MRRALATVLAVALAPAWAEPAAASRMQEALFQDDERLVHAPPATVARTLDELRALGVDRVRVSVVWRNIAPASGSDRRPEGFDAADHADYPHGAWKPWDAVVRLARARRMDVSFTVTAPAPDWATGTPARADLDETWRPSAEEFGRFVRAAGTRYDGTHGPGRVSSWSIQNEPNHPGWLTPQWIRRRGRWIEAAPRIYRAMVDAAWTALHATGHGADTILIGETAPKGLRRHRGATRAVDALRFVRRLFCLDDNLQVLRGAAARAQGCPTDDPVATLPARHPGLFAATGWAHHPYELLFAPDRRPPWRDWATMGNLRVLQGLLRRIGARYAQLPRGLPLFLTEFGYQTDPPDRLGVSRVRQAAYVNQAEYLAWRNRGVRTFAQFLLRDDGPPVSRTFQSGLRTVRGARKPAWRAYRFPIWVPDRTLRRGQRLRAWGVPRPAADGTRPRVRLEFRRRGATRWRRLATVRGDVPKGYVHASVRAPGTGAVRLAWNGIASRAVTIRRR